MTPADAARAYLSGQTTRQVAAAAGVHESTIRSWLRAADVPMRPRGPRAGAPAADILTLRRAQRMSWAQIAAATGMSATGARLAYRAATGGDHGTVDRRAHLRAGQAARLRRLAAAVPDSNRGSDRLCDEASRLRDALLAYTRAGVTAAELSGHVGVSPSRVGQIIHGA